MEANPLNEFLKTLYELVTSILEATLDAVLAATCVACVALAPWRWCYAASEVCKTSSRARYREECLGQAAMALFDCVAFALGLVSTLVPTRSLPLCRWTRDRNPDESSYDIDLRLGCLFNFACAVGDIACFPFLVLALVTPTRACPTLRQTFERTQENDENYMRASFGDIWLGNAVLAAVDLILAPVLLVTLGMLVRAWPLIKKLSAKRARGDWDYDSEARCAVLQQLCLSVVDLLILPFALVLVFTLVRAVPTCRDVRAALRRQPDRDDFCWSARGTVLRNASELVLDLTLVPLFLTVGLTIVRGRPLFRALSEYFCSARDDSDAEAQQILAKERWWRVRETVLRQTVLLLIDAAMLPLAALVLLTAIRSKPLLDVCRPPSEETGELREPLVAAADDNRETSPSWHLITLRQLGLLLLDVVVSPFLLLVAVTLYRLPQVVASKTAAIEWGAVNFHVSAVREFVVIVHDGVLLLPACLVLLATIYRVPSTVHAVRDSYHGEPQSANCCCADQASSGWAARGAVWRAFGNLLIDAPFILGGVVLVGTLWRADLLIADLRDAAPTASARRGCVWKQIKLLCRDVLALPALGVVVGTIVRLPRLCTRLWSVCARSAMTEAPLLTVATATLRFPSDAKSRLELRCTRNSDARPHIIAVRVHLLGETLWSEISRVFGAMIADVGRGLMPFRLMDLSVEPEGHFDLNSLNAEIAEHEAVVLHVQAGRVGMRNAGPDSTTRKRVEQALEMNGAAWLHFEYETERNERGVLLHTALPFEALRNAWHGAEGVETVSAETVSALDDDSSNGAGGGLRNALWLIALTECGQLLHDAAHVLLFLLLLVLAPWRAFDALRLMCAPRRRIAERAIRATVQCVQLHDEALLALRGEVLPRLNRIAKETHHSRPYAKLWDAVAEERYAVDLTRQLATTAIKNARKEVKNMMTTSEAGACEALLHRAEDLVEFSGAWVVHFPLRMNMMLYLSRAERRSHTDVGDEAQMREILEARDRTAKDFIVHSHRELQREADKFFARKQQRQSKSNIEGCRVIRDSAKRAVNDWGAALLTVGVVATVYRFPPFVATACARSRNPRLVMSRKWCVLALRLELIRFSSDMLCFLQLLCYSVVILLTLVRAIDFLCDISKSWHSLRLMRKRAKEHLAEIAGSLHELCLLLTAWKTYSMLFRAAVFLALLPAASIYEVVTAASSPDSARRTRVYLSIFAWLAACIVVLSPFAMQLSHELWMVSWVSLVGVLMTGQCVCTATSDRSAREFGKIASAVFRVTWLNVIAIAGLLIEFVALMVVVSDNGLRDDDDDDGDDDDDDANIYLSAWALPSNVVWHAAARFVQNRAVVWTAVSLTACWLAVEALPWVASSEADRETVTSAGSFTTTRIVANRCLLLPVLLVFFIQLTDARHATIPAPLAALLVLFLAVTAQLTCGAPARHEHGLDVRFSPAYEAVHQLLSCAVAATVLFVRDSERHLAAMCAATLLCVFQLTFRCFAGEALCAVPSVAPTRAASTSLVAIQAARQILHAWEPARKPRLVALAHGTIIVVGLSWAVVSTARARARRRAELEASEFPAALGELRRLRGRLVVADAIDATTAIAQRWRPNSETLIAKLTADASAETAAHAVLAFEDTTLAERLDPQFLDARRAEWVRELRASQTLTTVAALSAELRDAVRDPPTVAATSRLLRAWRRRREGLPRTAQLNILRCVIDFARIEALVEPACWLKPNGSLDHEAALRSTRWLLQDMHRSGDRRHKPSRPGVSVVGTLWSADGQRMTKDSDALSARARYTEGGRLWRR